LTRAPRVWLFILLMAGLTALFAGLGLWQMQRLDRKNQLVAAAGSRAGLDPVPLPPAAIWDGMAADQFDFTPVRLSGTYAGDAPVLVFTVLSDPRGTFGGPGYWIMQLFELTGGGRVWVNRGFVPENRMHEDVAAPSGEALTLTGLLRRPEAANPFTPPPDPVARRDYVRDPARLPPPASDASSIVAPFTVDLVASGDGLPQAGETVTSFPNRHFEYALTWFAFAALTPVLLGVWLWRQRHAGGRLAPSDRRD